MSQGLKISQKRKEKLFAKKIKYPTIDNLEKFKIYNKFYNKVRRAAKKSFYEKQFKMFAKDSKQTWSTIREILGTFFQHNSEIIIYYLEIADGFNTFFAGIGPKLAEEIGPSDRPFDSFLFERNQNLFTFSSISETDILRICKELKPKLSSGADSISTKLLKEIAPIIITPLHYLINLSLETGFVPPELKLAKIVQVFKVGNSHEFTNYIPIYFRSSMSKLFEKIV